MPYTNQDIYNFARKDAAYASGQGRGNALSKAVDLSIAYLNKGLLAGNEVEAFIYSKADELYHFNKIKIANEMKEWDNGEGAEMRIQLGLEAATIQEGDPVQFPKK